MATHDADNTGLYSTGATRPKIAAISSLDVRGRKLIIEGRLSLGPK